APARPPPRESVAGAGGVAPPSGAETASQGGRGQVDECRPSAGGVPSVRPWSTEDPEGSHPLVGGTSRGLESSSPSGGEVSETGAHPPPERILERSRRRSDREGAEAPSRDAVHLRGRARSAVAQQRSRDSDPTGSAVPEDQ